MALNKSSNTDNVLGTSTNDKNNLLMSGMREVTNFSSTGVSAVDFIPEKQPEIKRSFDGQYSHVPKARPGRPKQYMGETAVITLKTDKRVKDMATAAIKARKQTMVQYITDLIEKDFIENEQKYI